MPAPRDLRGTDTSLDAALANEATDELAAVLGVLCRRMSVLVPRPLQTLRHAWQSRPPAAEENTPTGARENIHRHYDLSNDLFETLPGSDADVLRRLVRAR